MHNSTKISKNPENLKKKFTESINDHKIYGKIIQLKLIPDYSSILDCEQEMIELQVSQGILSNHTTVNWFSKCIMPSSYFNEHKFRKKKMEIDQKINSIKLKRQHKESGYGFACFDHFEVISKLKKFERRSKTQDWWKCWQKNNNALKLPYFELFVNYVDFNWMNCFENKGVHYIKTYVLKILVFIILIFLSTPTAIIQIFNKTKLLEKFGYARLQEYLEGNKQISFIIQTYLPPLIILLINRVSLYPL